MSSSRVRATAKSIMRRATRSLGYEIVPFAVGIRRFEEQALSSVDLLVDVGANVGQFAERARSLGFHNDIVSFEPGAKAYEVLSHKARYDSHWEARRVALGRKEGTATLNVSANSVSSSLLEVGARHLAAAPESKTVASETVQVSTLDTELQASPGDHLYLKLDVQGFELPVLFGGRKSLERTDLIRCEISFDSLYDDQSSWLDVCAFLRDHGFVIRYLEPGYEDAQTGFMLQADLLAARTSWTPARVPIRSRVPDQR